MTGTPAPSTPRVTSSPASTATSTQARDLTDDADGNSGNGYQADTTQGDNPAAWAEISQDKFNSEAAPTPSNNKGAWSSATTYAAGNLVTRSGKYYRANGATTNDDPATQADKWGRIDDDSLSTENGSAQQQSGDSASGSDPNNGYRTIINGTSDNTPGDDDPTAARIRAAQSSASASINAASPSDSVVDDAMEAGAAGGTSATIKTNAVIVAGERHRGDRRRTAHLHRYRRRYPGWRRRRRRLDPGGQHREQRRRRSSRPG